jgi:hypothetical protein
MKTLRYLNTNRSKLQMNTISYLSGGLLGDFIHQLSVINETFVKTGRKGDLYITDDVGDKFRRGVEHTFNDIYSVVISQEYISSFKIHNGEKIDVNLSEWRNRAVMNSWQYIYSIYDVEWGKTPFLKLPDTTSEHSNTIFISTTPTRWPGQINFNLLFVKLKINERDIVFLCSDIHDYNHFSSTTGINIPYILCDTFESLVHKINGCLFLVGTLSMHVAVADALFKKRIALYHDVGDAAISMQTNSNGIWKVDDLHIITFLDRI